MKSNRDAGRGKVARQLTEEDKIKIIEFWKQGVGSCTIGIKLKLPGSRIATFLRNNGFVRNPEETRKLRKENGLTTNNRLTGPGAARRAAML